MEETYCGGNVLCRRHFVAGNVLWWKCDVMKRFVGKHFVQETFCGEIFCKCSVLSTMYVSNACVVS